MQNKLKRTKSAPNSPIKKQKGYFWLALISLALIAGIILAGYLFVFKVNEVKYVNANIGNEIYKLEVSDTDATRAKGLSERNGLAQNQGMLFDFKQDGDWRIWMKQMRFSIDIAWLDADKQVIYIKKNASPDDFPERYSADIPSRYVVEIEAGELERLGVSVGNYVNF